MKRLHWAILRALPLPFLAAFGTLLFLLLIQFLIKWLPELVGRGLPFGAMAELIAYSLAYMVTLAAPMAWLIAQLAAFGRLAESRAYAVIKSAGVPLWRLAWPTLVVGAMLVGALGYFNNVMLPEANFRMNALWRDISLSRPAFALEPGVFYTGVDGYAIRADAIPPDASGLLLGVTVVESRTQGGGQAVLAAKRATIQSQFGGQRLSLLLEDGEAHVRQGSGSDRYERLAFARHRVAFDLGSIGFERREVREGSRSDRSMPTSEMLAVIDSLETEAEARLDSTRRVALRLGRPLDGSDTSPVAPLDSVPTGEEADPFAPAQSAPPAPEGFDPPPRVGDGPSRAPRPRVTVDDSVPRATAPLVLAGVPETEARSALALATERARLVRAAAESAEGSARYERQRADRYRVEVYKKNSIALACLVFVLVGVPLGLAMPRAGVGVVATLAVAVFLFYWVTLVQGEKLADRGLLPPWLGMWAANVVVGIIGAYLVAREARDPAWRDPFAALAGFVKRRKG